MTLHGIDISHYQQGLSIAKADVDFAIMKATEGTSYTDPTCDGFVSQAKGSGTLFGVYHFAHTGSDAEADYFLRQTTGYHGHGILVLDWEADAVSKGVGAAKNWLDRVRSKTGVAPLIYMSQSVATGHDWSSVAKDYALWVARYGTDSYGDTGAWKSPAMWQYTSSGSVPGYSGNVDTNHFYGSRDAWGLFATGGSSPAPAPDPGPSPSIPHVGPDGVWGSGTTKQRQALLTKGGYYDGPLDGVVSHQNPYWKAENPGLTSGWDWDGSYKKYDGSKTIWADQKRLAKKKDKDGKPLYRGTIDGLAGQQYFEAIQREQQTPVDGTVSHPSTMVRAMQTDGNKGKIA